MNNAIAIFMRIKIRMRTSGFRQAMKDLLIEFPTRKNPRHSYFALGDSLPAIASAGAAIGIGLHSLINLLL